MEDSFSKQTTLPHLVTEGDMGGALPEMVGPYKIESLLSHGGMSLLYLGLDPDTKTPVAVKVLSPKYVSNEEVAKQFLHEADIIALTNHPNIVRLLGHGQWEGGLYITMEFIRGVSLRQFIVQRSLNLRRSLDIILQVAYSLLHLHTHGVIHRDLKPENIIITESGQVKVIDFGIAQLIPHGTEPPKKKGLLGGMIGTPSYMSPEQTSPPYEVDFNTDIYSLAIIAYELVTGQLSFGNIQLTLLPSCLRPIIEEALRPNADERTQDIVDFISSISEMIKVQSMKSGDEGDTQDLLEGLNRTQIDLLPKEFAPGPDFDVGIARPQNVLLYGIYYDAFRFADGNTLILLAEASENSTRSVVAISSLRATIRTLITPYLTATEPPFDHAHFVNQLNDHIARDPFKATYGLSSLHIDMRNDRFGFISCGESPLWHLTQMAQDPRLLLNHTPLLGASPTTIFEETSDTWYEGDTLLFHSFNNFSCTEKEAAEIEKEYKKAILEYRNLSCQNQAESIFSKMASNLRAPMEKQPKAILSIQRI